MRKNLRVFSIFSMLSMFFIFGFANIGNANTAPQLTPQSSGWKIQGDNVFGDRISMVSATDGWILSFAGQSAYLYRWDGTSWTQVDSVAHTQDIVRGDISMVSSTDGWVALGGPLGGGAESSLYRWDGNSWNLFDIYTDPNEVSFSSIDMISATDGWVAAAFKFGSKYYHWNGSNWVMDQNVWLPLAADESVDMVSSSDGWAVGFTGKITHWDGNDWLEVTSPVTTTLNSVSMISPTDGWAVGGSWNKSAIILNWNGASWTEVTSPVTTTLNSVSMISSTDGWAVGDDGVILHWDGSTWTQQSSPTIAKLNEVSMLSFTDGWIVSNWTPGFGGPLRYEIIPSLSINFTTGAAGSFFTITGSDFPPNEIATVSINGQELGTVPSDAVGALEFLLSTTNADDGSYFVTVSINPSASIRFVIDTDEPVRPQEGTGAVFDVPSGIAYTDTLYLPLVIR